MSFYFHGVEMLINLGLICLLFSVPVFGSEINIRVRLAKSQDKVKVNGMDLERKLIGKTRASYYPGKKSLSFNCKPVLEKVKYSKPLMLATIKSRTGIISWNKHKYRGKLKLIASKNHDGCDLVNELSLETYISTLLSKEMNSKWPIEALKAQAVAARSYAYHKKITRQVSKNHGYETFYDLENSEKHQVNGSFLDATYKTTKAARQTKGEVLSLPSGYFTPIFFHSKCGGKTLRPDQVWTNKVAGYKSVDCPFCHKHGKKNWSYKIKKKKLADYLEKALRIFYSKKVDYRVRDLKLLPDDKSRTNFRVYNADNPNIIQKSRLRQVLGRDKTPSNYYHIEDKGSLVVLHGKGYGHGVGMCQFGAYELAKRGYNYRQILSHYFPEHVIKKLY
jgi:stage II sporulation protein D